MTASGKIGDIFTLGETFLHNNNDDMTFNLVHNMVYYTGGGFGGKKESGQLRFGGRERPFRQPM